MSKKIPIPVPSVTPTPQRPPSDAPTGEAKVRLALKNFQENVNTVVGRWLQAEANNRVTENNSAMLAQKLSQILGQLMTTVEEGLTELHPPAAQMTAPPPPPPVTAPTPNA